MPFFFFFLARGWVSIFVAFSIFLSRQWWHVHLVLSCNVTSHLTSAITELPRWLVARIFATRVAVLGSVPTFSVEIFRIESYSHSCGYPARRLVFLGQCWDWLAQCQYTVTWWNSFICNLFLTVAACTIVCADPSLRYTSLLLGH